MAEPVLIGFIRTELASARQRASALAALLAQHVGADDPDVMDAAAEAHVGHPVLPLRRHASGLPQGVTCDGTRYRVRPYRNGLRIALGSFRSVEDALAAIEAYDAAQADQEPARIKTAPDTSGPAETSVPRGELARPSPGEVHGRVCEPTSPTTAPGPSAPQLPASDGVKGEAPALSPSLGVSSLDLPPPPRGEAVLSEPKPLKRDQVLDLYASTDLKPREIAARLGLPDSSPSAFISMGRTAGDDRVRRGDERRRAPRPLPSPAPRPIIRDIPESERRVPRFTPLDDDGRPLPKTGASRSKPLPPVFRPSSERKRLPVHLDLVPVGPIAVDESALVVAGPSGEWPTTRQCLKTLKALAELPAGAVFDLGQLRKRGEWAHVDVLKQQIPHWTRELAAIGITLGVMGRDNFYLTRTGAA